jgi:hypothetical protein
MPDIIIALAEFAKVALVLASVIAGIVLVIWWGGK